jgi:NADPH:quinone reductase-like Zn-dependent oxidoreductase
MRAAVISSTDSPPQHQEFREPEPSDGQTVVKVRLAGLNPVDLYRASGELGDPPLPSVAGSEGIAEFDHRRVYFASSPDPFGSLADRTLVELDQVFDVPDGLDDDLAVVIGIAGMAAWLPLTHHAPLNGGERVLILGASGVAGQLAVQAAKLLGAGYVVAAARDPEPLKPLLDRGADSVAVVGDDPGAALEQHAGSGFDVVADYIYGEPGLAALGQTRPGGTHVVVGGGAGQEPPIPFRTLQGRRLIGHANWFVPVAVRRDAYAAMAGHALAGRLAVEIECFKLDDIERAWQMQASSPHRKLVVEP